MKKNSTDQDPIETKEWLDALSSVIKAEGSERARFLLAELNQLMQEKGISTDNIQLISKYINTIPAEQDIPYPGNLELESTIESYLRWNAIAMVMRAKREAGGVGGHLSSYASIATLYEVGLNHFFKSTTNEQLGDLIYFQGHSSEGNYARAFLEGRLDVNHLKHFRQEIKGEGLSSYPHPWLMPNFWQFATVSLGLGLLQGVYQARFLKYLDHRHLLSANNRRVWVFCGDGEMDEPESIAGLSLAAREKLDNLIFVINCNLQRLDGLVRGNGKIVNELESIFKGAGWNVIKVLWDKHWDKLFAKDTKGLLVKRLSECLDGDLQTAQVRGPAYFREFIFNSDELKKLIEGYSDEQISNLHRGAHDPEKIYTAYHAAFHHQGQPTVILAQGIKGYGLGTDKAEGRNVAHNYLEMSEEELKAFRTRFKLPLEDQDLFEFNFAKPEKNSNAIKYLEERRQALGGYLPSREVISQPLNIPELSAFSTLFQGSGDRTLSTTMGLGRILNILLKDKEIAPRIVPIFSDEVRTFGLETLFRQVGIYSSLGQLYTPEDRQQFLYYNETKEGQVLEEGITEAGCMASWIAAATSYANNRLPMIPFFTYYSMFGFQRVGDLIWAASDMRARGFLIGGTAGRTTLEGEGLQHQDGSSLLTASTFPTARAYDPAFVYEMAVIIQHGLKEMFVEEKDVFYYLMAMNERYVQPEMPKAVEEGIIRGIYLFKKGNKGEHELQLFGSGAILNEVIAAQSLLESVNVKANVWSVTSYSELRREGQAIERINRLHPNSKRKTYLEKVLEEYKGPIIAASDYVRALPDLLRPYLPEPYVVLGTDGFGRSDTRKELRKFFEVDRFHIAFSALSTLYQLKQIDQSILNEAIKSWGIDVNKADPLTK